MNSDSSLVFPNQIDSDKTNFQSGSTVEYTTGTVQADQYGNLVLNGANSTDGEITVANDLEKQDGGTFTPSASITVSGDYTHTAGTVELGSTGFTVNGSNFQADGGTINGNININTTTLTSDGSSFGGTVTMAGSEPQSISGTTDPVFPGLIVNNANGITLNRAVSVSTTLTLTTGLVTTTTTNLLTLGSAGTATGDNDSYINGPLAIQSATGSTTFPIDLDIFFSSTKIKP